jgi:hypothetical protein
MGSTHAAPISWPESIAIIAFAVSWLVTAGAHRSGVAERVGK